ncbi:MAG: PspC domain-containing protein [Candidatus Parcubacteria bacterium]|nr:PspC domain-containing protein [Candidatus Parcubacteria bacterium]
MLIIFGFCVGLGLLLRKKNFKLDNKDDMFGGVCSGIAKTMGIQPFWLRLAFVLSFLLISFGVSLATVFLYITLYILLPEEEK